MMYRIIENSNGHPLKDLKFLVKGKEPNISHLEVFGCAVYVPIPPPRRTKMGPQRRLGIYVGLSLPQLLSTLLVINSLLECNIISFLDPRTNDSELEVQRIIHLQSVTNRLPDAFIDTKEVTKSHISAENVPARLEVPEATLTQTKASESQIRRKRGRSLGSKDANPRKRKEHIVSINHDANVTTSNVSKNKIPEVILSEDPKRNEQDLKDSYEMSINYAHNSLGWYRKEIKMNDIFAYYVAVKIIDEDDNDPQTMEECRHRNDWKSWKKTIQDELDSLNKREVFGPITPTPKGVKPVGYKWVFVRKRNEQNEVVRYKARLVAQGFTQKPGFDYIETYSPVVDATTLRFLISLSVIEQLKMQLMDVRIESGFVIITVYVDDLNIIGSPEEIRQAVDYLKSEFEMKDLGTTKYCLGLQFEHTKGGIFIHQSNYIEKVLKRFHMNNAHPLSTPMVVRSLDVNKDLFHPPAHNDEILGPEVPYLSAIDAGYLSDPHKAISQSGYVFMYGGTAISWHSTKQTLVATSSNHAEIKDGYIKGDRTKHISPKFFSRHELQVEGKVDVKQIPSSQNLADLFTKALPTKVFKQLVHNIGMRRLKDICLN
ncbi:UNVERIFIED_CONTAM: Copia protein [Sesamum calycinum]|uniref:Copia protein n=1 Tax=Sesamum calycinum TaxID=2727403 RepID=A0AAW2QW17_9LAMI